MQLDRIKAQWAATPLWQRLILAILLPLVVAGAIWFYVIKPDIEKRDRLLGERAQLQREIEKYRQLIKPQVLERLQKQLENLKAKEEEKKKELERVVGRIPTVEEVEKIFGEINTIAGYRNLVITKIALSQPKTLNLQLVEKEGRKLVRSVTVEQRKVRGRRPRKAPPQKKKQPRQQQPRGVPVTTMRVTMNLEGKSSSIRDFLKDIQRRGLVSYPVSLKMKPSREGGTVSADVVIDVILQR